MGLTTSWNLQLDISIRIALGAQPKIREGGRERGREQTLGHVYW